MKKVLIFTFALIQILAANVIFTSASEPILGFLMPQQSPSIMSQSTTPATQTQSLFGSSQQQHTRHRRGHNKGKNYATPVSPKAPQNPRSSKPNFPQGNH